jgi:hypothetical protein
MSIKATFIKKGSMVKKCFKPGDEFFLGCKGDWDGWTGGLGRAKFGLEH